MLVLDLLVKMREARTLYMDNAFLSLEGLGWGRRYEKRRKDM